MSVCNDQLPQEPTTVTGIYRRRKPERTAVYQVVQHHLETWLDTTREANPDHDPIPQHVERDLRKFPDCGILARGFARPIPGTRPLP